MMFNKVKKSDRNLIVIGGGSAGLVSALIAATLNAKVTLIEKHKMGGDCLNTGCVPSKALIKSAKVASLIKRANEFGINVPASNINFPAVMKRIQSIISKIEPHDSVERLENLGVECIKGEAKIISPWSVEINGKILTTRSIIVATGAQPFVPHIKGIDQLKYLTSDNLWDIKELPKRLIVLGGGPIGCELSQAFARLGSQVTQIEILSRIMIKEDNEVASLLTKKFEDEGIEIRTDHVAKEIVIEGNKKKLICEKQNETVEIQFDEILIAIGRTANSNGFGLEELGVKLNPNKTVHVNEKLQSSIPNIYACGDVAGPYQLTHTASHQAWHATVNALFGKLKSFKVDYSVIPWATFTDPEIARVGLNEQEAKERGLPYDVTSYGIDDLDRAITEGEDHGIVKVLTVPGKDRILGVTIIGHNAGELITEYISAMKYDFGMNKILSTIHIYPTFSEANKFVAGAWKKANAPKKLLKLVAKYHRWMRS
jgi:dihydrolipoamide dehydrogenase